MTNANHPGGTEVDENGVLIRTKPDPNAPKPDPKLVADDDANLLFFSAALVGDPALQRRVWTQLGIADAKGTPLPKMTDFIRANQEWGRTRVSVMATITSAAQAKAYVDAHLK